MGSRLLPLCKPFVHHQKSDKGFQIARRFIQEVSRHEISCSLFTILSPLQILEAGILTVRQRRLRLCSLIQFPFSSFTLSAKQECLHRVAHSPQEPEHFFIPIFVYLCANN